MSALHASRVKISSSTLVRMDRGGNLLLGILKESAPGETRVALLPESLKPLLAQGISVTVEPGAGLAAGASDRAYIDAGATI